jgi:hypothetical protein
MAGYGKKKVISFPNPSLKQEGPAEVVQPAFQINNFCCRFAFEPNDLRVMSTFNKHMAH